MELMYASVCLSACLSGLWPYFYWCRRKDAKDSQETLERFKYWHLTKKIIIFLFSVQFSSSVVSDSLRPHWLQHASLLCTSSFLKLMSIESVMPSNHLILCDSLLLLPSIFSNTRVFSNELALRIRWPKYWNFSFSIRPFNEYSGLISFRIDLFYFLAVQGTLKSLLQHHSLKISVQGKSFSLSH